MTPVPGHEKVGERTSIAGKVYRGAGRSPRLRAFTLAELLVAAALASLVVLAAVSGFVFSSKSFATMYSHTDLNNRSRNASDVLSRDIRSAVQVASLTANQIVLNAVTGGTVTYKYDAEARTLSRSTGNVSLVLLTGVDAFLIKPYQRPVASASYEAFVPATNVSTAKVVSFRWTCSRHIGGGGAVTNLETIQTAMVDLRNQ